MGRPAAEIRARLESKSGRYQVAFLENPGHWYNSPEHDRTKALAWARRSRDRLVADPSKRILFRDLTRDFFAKDGAWRRRQESKGQEMSDRHVANYAAMLARYLVPLFGDEDPRELLARQIDDAILDLKGQGGRELAPATKYKIAHCMGTILQDLSERGIIDKNPLTGLRPYSKKPKRARGAIPRPVLEALFPPGHGPMVQVWGRTMWAAMALVFRDTGMRPGEARALTWADIYPKEEAVVVRKAQKAGGELGGTKTGASRAGSLSVRTLQELAIWRLESRHSGDSDLVFHTEGKAISGAGFGEAMRAALKRIGQEGAGYTPYWIRHSFVTYALAALDAREVALLAGHSEAIAKGVYSHPDDEVVIAQSKAARAKLPRT